MKKKIIIAITILCVTIIANTNINFQITTQTKTFLSKNIEALASGEGSGGRRACYYSGIIQPGYTYVDCLSCQYIYDKKGVGNPGRCL